MTRVVRPHLEPVAYPSHCVATHVGSDAVLIRDVVVEEHVLGSGLMHLFAYFCMRVCRFGSGSDRNQLDL